MSENLFGYESAEQFATDINAVVGLSHNIGGQNDRFDQIPAVIDDAEFASIAREGIKLEQARTINDLNDLVEILPFDELGESYASLETEVALMEEGLASAEAAIAEDVAKIDANLEKTIGLAPLMEDSARELAQRQKDALRQQYLDDHAGELEPKKQELARLAGLFSLASEAWPIPEAVNYYETESVTAERTIVDEIPLQPVLTGRQSEELERLRTREVDAPEASQYIALLLSENRGRVVTVDDIVTYLYSPDVIQQRDARNLRSRVTTLLGPKIQGVRIANMLANDNLILQYGFRRVIERDEHGATKMSAPTRIYRAVPYDQIDQHPAQLIEEHGLAQFDTTRVLAIPPKQVPAPAAAPVPRRTTSTPTVPAKRQRRRNRSEEPKSDWREELRTEIGSAIDALHAWDLMSDEELSARQIARQSGSAKLGTKTSVERLINAGVLGRVNMQHYQDALLTPEQRVAMYLQNGSPEVFSNPARLKEATKIITAAVASYRKHQAEQAR